MLEKEPNPMHVAIIFFSFDYLHQKSKMKYLCSAIAFVFLCTSCNEQAKKTTEENTDTSVTAVSVDSVPVVSPPTKDSLLAFTHRQILQTLKTKDFEKLAAFIHPTSGARFSPYGHIDTSMHRKFLPQQFINALKGGKKMLWGYYDGSGDSIKLSVDAYFKKFVYNADFLNAKQTSINKMIGSGNSLNNLQTIYKDADFIESYFPGFDAKYNGMDWTALRLVYRKYEDKFYLVAVVHDQWTI